MQRDTKFKAGRPGAFSANQSPGIQMRNSVKYALRQLETLFGFSHIRNEFKYIRLGFNSDCDLSGCWVHSDMRIYPQEQRDELDYKQNV